MANAAKQKFNVCVIEDDLTMQKAIVKALHGNDDLVVKCAADGADAWKLLEKTKFDIIILDWKLPSVSGVALMNRLRRNKDYQFTPVLVISGFLGKKDFSLLEEL